MPAATSIAIAGLALAAAGTAVSIQQQAKGNRAAKKASKEEEKARAQASARERRKTIRETRVARGAALNAANQVGAGESSGLSGGLSSLSTQRDSNLGFSINQEEFGKSIARFQTKANKAFGRAATAQGVSDLGAAAFSFAAPRSELFS